MGSDNRHDCGNDACWGEYDHERERQFKSMLEGDPAARKVPERIAWRIFSEAYDIGFHKGREAG